MTAQISWALCPNGIDTTKGAFRFSVLVSPQITALGDLGSWPTTMMAMTASLMIGGTPITLPPAYLDATLMKAYPTLWATLFPSTAPVAPMVRKNYSTASIISYDTHGASQQVHAAYQQLAQTPTPKPVISSMPLIATMMQQAQAAVPAAQASASVLKVPTLPATGSPKLIRPPGGLQVQSTIAGAPPINPVLYYAAMFHNRGDMRGSGAAPAAPTPATPDFHDVLAQLADQPEVLRALGMILDYEVPLGLVASLYTTPGTSTVNIHFVPGMSVPGTQTTPMTTCELGATFFYASTTLPAPTAPPTQVDRGLLTIDDSRFLVEQLEIDHAVSKITNAAVNADLVTTNPSSLPALHSHGFNILHQNRDQHISARLANTQTVLAAGSAAILASDDIVRGYRVDVSTDGTHWSSLCKRQGTITVGAGTSVVTVTLPTPATVGGDYVSGRDEGYVKASAPTSPSDSPGLLQVGETMFGWHGWSLVARHPANAVGFAPTTGAQNPGNTVMKNDPNASPPGSPYTVSQAVVAQPGTLPKLRYGRKYQFRARVVDLAGNSVPLSTTTTHVTPAQTFGRYDPVSPPTLVPRKQITEGEALERLVVRSSGVSGVTATAFAATINTATGETAAPEYFGTCERHVAPPKTSHINAELHGEFDALIASTSVANALTVASNNGSFFQTQPGWHYVDPEPTGRQVLTALPAPLAALPGAAPNHGAYVFIDAASVTLPYLPDPIASGMQVTSSVMPFAQPTLSAQLAFTKGAWPSVTPFRVVLADSNGAAPSINTTGGTLNVSLPAGTMLWLDYASTIPASALPSMGWYQELVERPASTVASSTLAAIETAATAGQHWMFTPKRQLQLVHATLKPVQAPALTGFTAARVKTLPPGLVNFFQIGNNNTFAYLNGTITAHAPSTAHVALLATWSDWDDNAGAWVTHNANVALTQLAYQDDSKAIVNVTHEFADTKARQVSYAPVATTRYREYFPASMTANPSAITVQGATVGVAAAHGSSNAGVVIPSSRNPPAPKPLYVVPSFVRTSGAGTSLRQGGALRVYLDRPWFDSGFGEQLAIVCAPANPPPSAPVATLDKLSQCGADPQFTAGNVSFTNVQATITGMSATCFPVDASGRMKLISNYALPDGSYVDLVVYDVERSQDGRGVFFVDVVCPIAFGFTSLSVARYQPNSLPGVELSSVTRTDFTRISADRTASVTASTTSPTVSVSVMGVSAGTQPLPQATVGGVGGGGGGGGGTGPKPMLTIIQPTPAQYGAAASAGRYVQATLEYTSNPAPADLDNEIGWSQASTVTLTPTSPTGATVTWSGALTLNRTSNTRYRIVFREFEVRGTDPDVAQSTPWMGNAGSCDALVYSDIVPFT